MSDRIVIEVELPGFYADDIRSLAADLEGDLTVSEVVEDAMHLNSDEVVVVFALAPGEKGQNHEKELVSMTGLIVGYRLRDDADETCK